VFLSLDEENPAKTVASQPPRLPEFWWTEYEKKKLTLL